MQTVSLALAWFVRHLFCRHIYSRCEYLCCRDYETVSLSRLTSVQDSYDLLLFGNRATCENRNIPLQTSHMVYLNQFSEPRRCRIIQYLTTKTVQSMNTDLCCVVVVSQTLWIHFLTTLITAGKGAMWDRNSNSEKYWLDDIFSVWS